jgi:catechol 2,3-dioxygenase-like lactoylglutathione lyase family enzyme
MSIKSVAHVCVKSTDLDATAAFYCGPLGMTRHFDFMRQGKLIGFYMKATNETFVEVFLADEVEAVEKRVLNHFCLETEDLKGLHEKLVAAGYTPGKITLGCDHTSQFWMKDPNGMDLEFQEYTDKSAQRVPHTVEVNW